MIKIFSVAILAFLCLSCADESNDTPSLLHKWYYDSVTINEMTARYETKGCERDFIEFTEDLWQTTIHTRNEDQDCAVISSIGEYDVIGNMIHDRLSSAPRYEIISITSQQLVLHDLIPTDIDGDDLLDDVTYIFSRQ